MWAAPAAQAQLGRWFVPTTRVDADPGAEYSLTENNGPWLIMAATFSGEGAERQARALVLEFRQRYNLPAYLHSMALDFSAGEPAHGPNELGAPPRKRYRREEEKQFAVLVGDFPTVDEPDTQHLLDRVKNMQPDALKVVDGGKSAQSLVQLRAFQNALLSKLGIERARGPMGQAFLARNPLLPDEYFVPKGVDKLVVEMNQGVKHSLLDCPGRYTVRVATFRGRSILLTGTTEPSASKLRRRRAKDQDDALAEAAENAHLLTELLRARGWDAYEFHDRTESVVTIGSFDQVVRKQPDGREVATPAVQRILETFGAAYDTPADPLSDVGNDARTQQTVDQQEQQFRQRLDAQRALVMPGMNPKHAKIFKGPRRNGDVERFIPFDVYPQVMEAPKQSISGAYVR
jgi:hypothetical protein